jgi:pseudaminic acid biosynthesis-associated methylase
LFSEIFTSCAGINSVFEVGPNIGLNLIAINSLIASAELSAVEINSNAFAELKKLKFIKEVYNNSILEFEPDKTYDFVFTKGVLIHINPNELETVYEKMYRMSKKYIMVAEYYSPSPVVINYRGHENKLFKRDFAGELLEKYSDLELVKYGFRYRRDNFFKQDDFNWFLMRKK